jgi:hypothetical protein
VAAHEPAVGENTSDLEPTQSTDLAVDLLGDELSICKPDWAVKENLMSVSASLPVSSSMAAGRNFNKCTLENALVDSCECVEGSEDPDDVSSISVSMSSSELSSIFFMDSFAVAEVASDRVSS